MEAFHCFTQLVYMKLKNEEEAKLYNRNTIE